MGTTTRVRRSTQFPLFFGNDSDSVFEDLGVESLSSFLCKNVSPDFWLVVRGC